VSSRAQQFVEVYRQARIEDQRSFYERRANSFQTAQRQLLLTSAIVFGVSAALGLIAGLDVPGKLVWAILAAILPAVTTVLSAYEGLYAFERIAKLYRDAARNLRRVETPNLSDAADDCAAVAQYVAEVEQIFTNERGQWGQLAVETAPEQAQT
jgi:SMODS and SLOG-associating 2TM effector domain 1